MDTSTRKTRLYCLFIKYEDITNEKDNFLLVMDLHSGIHHIGMWIKFHYAVDNTHFHPHFNGHSFSHCSSHGGADIHTTGYGNASPLSAGDWRDARSRISR